MKQNGLAAQIMYDLASSKPLSSEIVYRQIHEEPNVSVKIMLSLASTAAHQSSTPPVPIHNDWQPSVTEQENVISSENPEVIQEFLEPPKFVPLRSRRYRSQRYKLKIFDNPLISATLEPQTQLSYSAEVLKFFRQHPLLPLSPLEADKLISKYIQAEFERLPSPGNKTKMGYLVCGLLIVYPHLRDSIGLSRRSLKGWNKLTPPESAVPLTESFLTSFFGYLMRKGNSECAVAMCLAWSGLLRGNEVIALQWEDFAFPGDPRLSHAAIKMAGLRIKKAKTGTNQFVPIQDPAIIRLMRSFASGKQINATSKIFNVSYRQYLQAFSEAAEFFGFGEYPLTTHSTRIGGALHAYTHGVDAADICTHGRWKSLSSLQYYLNNAKGWLLRLPMNRQILQRLHNMRLPSILPMTPTENISD